MNRYQPSTPRTPFGIAAAVLTAMTIGIAVVLPAKMDAGSAAYRPSAAKVVTPAVTEASIIPARFSVQGVREPELASAPADNTGARCNDEG
jgi:hypothetical protein